MSISSNFLFFLTHDAAKNWENGRSARAKCGLVWSVRSSGSVICRSNFSGRLTWMISLHAVVWMLRAECSARRAPARRVISRSPRPSWWWERVRMPTTSTVSRALSAAFASSPATGSRSSLAASSASRTTQRSARDCRPSDATSRQGSAVSPAPVPAWSTVVNKSSVLFTGVAIRGEGRMSTCSH